MTFPVKVPGQLHRKSLWFNPCNKENDIMALWGNKKIKLLVNEPAVLAVGNLDGQ